MNVIWANERKDKMTDTSQQMLAQQAFLEIEQLFSDYDFYGQIESALPLLCRHRRTVATLRNALLPTNGASQVSYDNRWVDDLVAVYKELGGQALDSVVYRRMKQLRQSEGRSWPTNAESVIRQVRQAHNIKSRQYKNGRDLFRMVQRGLWRLKENS
jgi:hypothetical protein